MNVPAAAATILLAVLAGSTTARASDSCLVGHWEPQGNAMAEWLGKQHPQMAVHAPPAQARLSLNADGSYASTAAGAASTRSGEVTASMQGRFASSGRWRTEGNMLHLLPTQASNQARMQLDGPGTSARMQVPPAVAGGSVQWAYRCSGNRMETHQRLPGSNDVVIQPYLRK